MRVLFINKFIPPDPAPTAVLIDALARMLAEAGEEVTFASSHAGYRGNRATSWRRWIREGWANLQLLRRGLSGPRPDVIICLTDPPGCLVIAAIIARLRRAKLVHWVMDVYPELAVALGELRRGSAVHRSARAGMRWAYNKCAAIACLDEDMIDALGLRENARAFISTPWPPSALVVPPVIPSPDRARVRWLYSGNLGRAHDYETLLRAQRRLEDIQAPFELVFQGGGPCRDAAMRMAADLRLEHCRWLDYAPEAELLESMLDSHVLVATQKLETRGLLWPSKLAAMLALPRPIVWVGPIEGAVAKLLRRSGTHRGVFAPGDDQALASWLMESRGTLLQVPVVAAEEIKQRLAHPREDSLKVWRDRLKRLFSDTGE